MTHSAGSQDALPGPALYERTAALAQALSSPARLRLLNVLAQSPRSVDALARRLQQSAATTSAQLKVLAQAKLVRRQAHGQRAVYSLADEASVRLWMGLRDHVLEAATDLQQSAEQMAPAYRGDLAKLSELVRRGRISLLDLRPEEEWRAGHLPGASSLPFEALGTAIDGLQRSRRYVIYCTGPLCSKAIWGTRKMREEGLRATRLPAGVVEWKQAGLTVQTQLEASS